MKAERLNTRTPTVIYTSGKIIKLQKRPLKLQQIKDIIGNDINPLDLGLWAKNPKYEGIAIISDKEGIKRYKQPNTEASELIRDIIGPNAPNLFGPIIIMPLSLFKQA